MSHVVARAPRARRRDRFSWRDAQQGGRRERASRVVGRHRGAAAAALPGAGGRRRHCGRGARRLLSAAAIALARQPVVCVVAERQERRAQPHARLLRQQPAARELLGLVQCGPAEASAGREGGVAPDDRAAPAEAVARACLGCHGQNSLMPHARSAYCTYRIIIRYCTML